MIPDFREKILSYLRQPGQAPVKPRQLARELEAHLEEVYPFFRDALRDLEDEGVIDVSGGLVKLARVGLAKSEVIGIFSGNKRGFGFLDIKESGDESIAKPGTQLFVPGEHNELRAVSGDVVKARVLKKEFRQPGDLDNARVVAILKRAHSRIAGTLGKNQAGEWCVYPSGNVFVDPILTPDAAGKYMRVGTQVIVELTQYPDEFTPGQGVIAEALGERGEKDVDLRMTLTQFNLPEDFPEPVKAQARAALERFDPELERKRRLDLTKEVILTIDPDDAKDYDDAISLKRNEDGTWELGVHIADVSFFVEKGTPLDVEANHRGNSTYFPGHVVPMLPEVLSNGVCSLQEAVPRLVKSAFIDIDPRTGNPVRTRFANAIIHSRKRLRYREAQALIDGAETIPHPDGDRTPADYDADVKKLLADMNHVARLIQKRRQAAGQLVLDLPKVDLVLDQDGKVVNAVPEDDAFTHTLIEMFMVEANEATARLFDKLDLPFIRRTHPDPDPDASARLSKFMMVAGHRIPEEATRHDLQKLLAGVKGKPEGFAVNLSVLKSLARAEYSPKKIGHYALASDNYCHFTSPIRRYADLTVHRLIDLILERADAYQVTFNEAVQRVSGRLGEPGRHYPSFGELTMLGQHLSFTERRSDEAERDLRQVKLLELMEGHVGEEFLGVVTAITKFGLFIQLDKWLVEGLVRYPELLNDFWQVDEKSGTVRGKRTGQKIHVGDLALVKIARVDVSRRELDVHVIQLKARGSDRSSLQPRKSEGKGKRDYTEGKTKRAQRSRSRDKRKTQHRRDKDR